MPRVGREFGWLRDDSVASPEGGGNRQKEQLNWEVPRRYDEGDTEGLGPDAGRPGAHLQVSTNLGGGWQDLSQTDGTNWTVGSSWINGFVSRTNWPTVGNTFFRLIKP